MWVGMRTFLVAPHKIVSIRDNFAALFAGYFREGVLVGHWTTGWEFKVYHDFMYGKYKPCSL